MRKSILLTVCCVNRFILGYKNFQVHANIADEGRREHLAQITIKLSMQEDVGDDLN